MPLDMLLEGLMHTAKLYLTESNGFTLTSRNKMIKTFLKRNVVRRLSMEKIHLKIAPSDTGQSGLKLLEVFSAGIRST